MTTPPAEPETPHRPTVVEWLIDRWPTTTRRRVAIVVAVVAIFIATFIASSRLLRFVFEDLDVLAYVGLFVACWVGAGGAIVPIPGVRLVSWFMIVQQGAVLDPVIVVLISAVAMLLGQTSYFVATRAAAHRVARVPDEHPDEEAATGPATESGEQPPDVAHEVTPSRRARYAASAGRRVQTQIHEHGMATVFLVCALPTPVTTITTTAAATTGMSYLRFAFAAFAGYVVLASILTLIGLGLIAGARSIFV